jgi:DNA-binding beta-propeller fold protein YncE
VAGTPSSIAVDKHDNVWLLHRPRLVPDESKDKAAPAVIELDPQGRFLQAWGGPGDGYQWPDTEHSIFIDDQDQVWICGSGAQDDVVLKFTNKGKFLMQIGKEAQTKGNADTANLNQPADLFVYKNELFVADGYGNRRVIVFDVDTGAYKRMFGAFGNTPEGDRLPQPVGVAGRGAGGRGAATIDASMLQNPQFQLPHSAAVSTDGLVYVADRSGRRVQIFGVDGKYVTQLPVHADGPAATSAAAVAFSPDAAQSLLYVCDNGELKVLIFDRKSLKQVGELGGRGANPGEFTGLHDIAVDSRGYLYTAEVTGQRFQKFTPKK